MGRIYEEPGRSEALRWFWALHGPIGRPASLRTRGHAPTLEEARTQLEASWRQWLALGEPARGRVSGWPTITLDKRYEFGEPEAVSDRPRALHDSHINGSLRPRRRKSPATVGAGPEFRVNGEIAACAASGSSARV